VAVVLAHAERSASADGSLGASEGALDLHEGICDPRTGCGRWPEDLKLLNERTGELLEGRCKATNLCRYCQRLYVLETVEMLTLDALEHAPTLWVVLTAREHLTREQTYAHLRQLRRAARKRWPAIEWFVQVEFQRRGALHLNLLIKGVPVDELHELRSVLVSRWCARVDAEPVGQWAGAVQDAAGVTRYIAKMLAHGLKAEQAPPIGWRGHRTSQTRGYLVRPASVMRQEAREALAFKRALWRAQRAGLQAHDAELAAHQERAEAQATSWSLRHDRVRARPVSEGEERLRWRGVSAPVWNHVLGLGQEGEARSPEPGDCLTEPPASGGACALAGASPDRQRTGPLSAVVGPADPGS
jgi:hypothetical protein